MSSPAEQTTDPPTRSRVLRYDVGFGIDGDDASQVAVEVHWPPGEALPLALFCLPGGAMNRRFYDLVGEDGDESFSFAREMAARGLVSVLVDPPGIGDSDRPADGYALTPERLADVLAQVCDLVVEDLRRGDVDPGLAPLPEVATVGLGHSMGALLAVLQQHRHRQHAAIALLGFGTGGLPQYLSPEAAGLAADTGKVRAEMVRLARAMFRVPYPDVASGGGDGDFYGGSRAEPGGKRALMRARDRLLPVPAFMSLLPGNVAPEAAAIDVPVYLALGELDFAGRPDEVPESFTGSPGVTVQTLPETGHSFFLFPSRHGLFDGLADWARTLTANRSNQR